MSRQPSYRRSASASTWSALALDESDTDEESTSRQGRIACSIVGVFAILVLAATAYGGITESGHPSGRRGVSPPQLEDSELMERGWYHAPASDLDISEETLICHDLSEADDAKGLCLKEINWARTSGIVAHPEWYPGLTASSPISQWQESLYKSSRGKCPKTCSWRKSQYCEQNVAPPMWKPVLPNNNLAVKILCYNLYWWNLFGVHNGEHNGQKHAAANLIQSTNVPPYDVMGFQECENKTALFEGTDLLREYTVFVGTHAICMGYRTSKWTLLEQGEDDVAEDQHTEYYGSRGTQWMRLEHNDLKTKLLFLNHHGPLSVNSGGQCGGVSTAYNLLSVISRAGRIGDVVVLVGDFNADAGSLTVQKLWQHLVLIYNGESFGGVDNIFSNVGKSSISVTKTLGSGGSDHKAISATLELGQQAILRLQAFGASVAREPGKAVADSSTAACGLLESDVEYAFDAHVWSKDHDLVTDPRVCCSLCAKDNACRSWILIEWVASLSGPCCSLKYGTPTRKVSKPGVVSGMPPAEALKVTAANAHMAISEL